MTRPRLAVAATLMGAVLVCAGLALIFLPAALIALGGGLLTFGLLGVDVAHD